MEQGFSPASEHIETKVQSVKNREASPIIAFIREQSPTGAMEIKRKKFWIVFVCTQALGVVSLPFANVHSNGLALLVAVFLLFPGTIAFQILPSSLLPQVVLAVSLNLVFWYGLTALVLKLRKRRALKGAFPDRLK